METHIAMLSGGRDSTAMVELLLSQGKPLDYIIFTDTLHEFPMMYEYLQKFDKYIQEKYNKHITYVKPKSTFRDWVFGEVTRGERKGKIRGLPMLSQPCFWKRESKVKPAEQWIKDNNILDPILYIGYTYSEQKRSNVKATNQLFPLIENKVCEADVDTILEKIDMVNPLYEFFERTGCSFCPYMSDRAYYVLYDKFPDVWDYMKNIELELLLMDNALNKTWDDNHTMTEREDIFNKYGHKYNLDAPKSCECKLTLFDEV